MWVFLDSNIYIAARYVFDKEPFEILSSLIKRGRVKLIYTSVVEGEVLQHISDDIGKVSKDYNKMLSNNSGILTRHAEFCISKIDVDEAIETVKTKFRSFLERTNAQCISLNPVDAELLIRDYFELNPPFDKSKRNEFKDALIVNALKQFMKTNTEGICIVSRDQGFVRAFEQTKYCKIFLNLKDFIHYQQELDERERALAECVARALDDEIFDTQIKDYIEQFDINYWCYSEWYLEEFRVENIDGTLSYIDTTEDGVVAYIDVEADIFVQISYRDEEESYYDKEDGRYLFEKYITTSENHRINTEVAINCIIEENEDLDISDHNIICETPIPTFYLDEDTLLDCRVDD